MEKQNIQVSVENGVKELVIREGDAAPMVQLREGVHINGNIDVVTNHLKNPSSWLTRADEDGNTPLENSYVEINRSERMISFIEDAGMGWESSYRGVLHLDDALKDFQINTGKSWTTFELADHIKMNRSFFETKDTAMRLVGELRNLKVKVDKDVEAMDDQRGNKKVLVAQAIESNIPEAFNLLVPVFKGHAKQTIQIEVNINASDFSCTLISPELNDYINETRDQIIDNEIATIKELFGGLRIFEK